MASSEDLSRIKLNRIHYYFHNLNQGTKKFTLLLNPDSLSLIRPEATPTYPAWTQLPYCQCPNCPLTPETHPRCPVAENASDAIETFKESVSYWEVDVEVVSEARSYRKTTSLQNGLSSLIGLYMVTSGCPILDKLRPVAYIHLPFATLGETAYRVTSMYLLSQYFVLKHGGVPDWEMKGLPKLYEAIQIVNTAFHKRICKVHVQDAGLNAVFHLDCFAKSTNMMLLEEGLNELERFFVSYLGIPSADSGQFPTS